MYSISTVRKIEKLICISLPTEYGRVYLQVQIKHKSKTHKKVKIARVDFTDTTILRGMSQLNNT